MQRFEDYGLLGTMRPASELAAMSDAMVRRTLDSLTTKGQRTQKRGPEKPKRTVSPAALERRPLRTVTHGGAARLHHGAGLEWALRELHRADPAVVRAHLAEDPALWLRAAANLDRLEAQLRGRPSC